MILLKAFCKFHTILIASQLGKAGKVGKACGFLCVIEISIAFIVFELHRSLFRN
jgi:hypothetical protein